MIDGFYGLILGSLYFYLSKAFPWWTKLEMSDSKLQPGFLLLILTFLHVIWGLVSYIPFSCGYFGSVLVEASLTERFALVDETWHVEFYVATCAAALVPAIAAPRSSSAVSSSAKKISSRESPAVSSIIPFKFSIPGPICSCLIHCLHINMAFSIWQRFLLPSSSNCSRETLNFSALIAVSCPRILAMASTISNTNISSLYPDLLQCP
ncbi:hypothetical protein AXF42_Ash016958 [Apostasia shenzhenica]|uniref:Uncharacterized protein n=1 Tax=Apostasia shenzhenica TaxID=1088818 RepID=A0A2H9ZRL3_9ASPA|nr:hypothetical protein AXF42_Ash016958 [Apostasia shenzhenica]